MIWLLPSLITSSRIPLSYSHAKFELKLDGFYPITKGF